MKAMILDRFGAQPELRELPTPVPRENEVLIRVVATTVSTGDWRARTLEMPRGFGVFGRLAFGLRKPRQPILGTELSGRIEAVGKAVTRFKVGDEVFAFPGAKQGAHAEYVCLAETGPVALKPKNLSFEQAAALSFGGATALHFFRRGKVGAGDKVLVNGASGCVGSACVQIAKHLGATVTAVCGPANVDLVRSLGASQVIDYTKDDFTKHAGRYDVIVDTAGTAPYSRSKVALTPSGRLLVVLGTLAGLFVPLWVALTSKRRMVAEPASERVEDLRTLAALAEAGAFTPVIDRVYPFSAMADAHERVASGHKRGSVVVTVVPVERAVSAA